MHSVWTAILAVAAISVAAIAGGVRTLDEPFAVVFRLADDVRIRGHLTEWDDDGFDGSFGRRRWVDLKALDTWKLRRRLMDREQFEEWVGLGAVLLRMPNGERHAEQAFAKARSMSDEAKAAIEAVRAAIKAEQEAEQRRIREAEAAQLRTTPPEARQWRPDPWPALTSEEQSAAVDSMKADAIRILDQAGVVLEPIETDYFLFYSDMPREETVRWAVELDNMYERLAEIFDLEKGKNIFWGKAVIFVFNDRDRFRLVEASSFGQLAPAGVAGYCHCIGPKVFVNFYRQTDRMQFAAVLVHETVHGFMHRFRTPRRLPAWANEGFAEWVAATVFTDSPVDANRRPGGLQWIREGNPIYPALDWNYPDGSWPGPGGVGYDIGYLVVELMIRDRPRAFGRWVEAYKAGKIWEQALIEDFGTSREQLAETVGAFYRVND